MERKPAKKPSGCNCCPARYRRFPFCRAFVTPPGTGMVAVTADGAPGGTGAPLLMMIPATGRKLTLACVPPHSGPQFRMKAVVPSAEKTAFVGRSKVPGTGSAQYTGIFCGSQSTAFEGNF